MMQWTPLRELPDEDFLRPETRKQRDALNKRIGEVAKAREGFEKLAAKQVGADVLKIDSAYIDIPIVRSERFRILQEEAKLRSDLPGYFEARNADADAAYTATLVAHEAKRREIIAGLEALGYKWIERPTEPTIGRIEPGWIFTHPEVRALKDRADTLRGLATQRSWFEQNADALQKAREELEAIRAHATGIRPDPIG